MMKIQVQKKYYLILIGSFSTGIDFAQSLTVFPVLVIYFNIFERQKNGKNI